MFVERNSCPVCNIVSDQIIWSAPLNSKDLITFLDKHYDHNINHAILKDHHLSMMRCPECALIWQNPILCDEGMTLLYEHWIDSSKSKEKNRTHPASFFRALFNDVLFVVKLFPKKQPYEINVLDFGMGWGSWSKVAKAHGLNVFGAELSQSRIEHGRTNGIQEITDLISCSFEFDYINTEQVLEHISDLNGTMAMLASKLKKNGILRFSVPNNIQTVFQLKWSTWKPSHDALHPLEHINCFSNKSIRTLAIKHNLKIVNVYFFLRQALSNPSLSIYIFKRMITHYWTNNVLLIKN
jgi:2-polyprenyl-3-methyl-5-hydroxy-6-metoxy-1,4-benzoquinol methylase